MTICASRIKPPLIPSERLILSSDDDQDSGGQMHVHMNREQASFQWERQSTDLLTPASFQCFILILCLVTAKQWTWGSFCSPSPRFANGICLSSCAVIISCGRVCLSCSQSLHLPERLTHATLIVTPSARCKANDGTCHRD